jgi:hypothetical protein
MLRSGAGGAPKISIDEAPTPKIPAENPADILAVDDALEQLAEQDERMAKGR